MFKTNIKCQICLANTGTQRPRGVLVNYKHRMSLLERTRMLMHSGRHYARARSYLYYAIKCQVNKRDSTLLMKVIMFKLESALINIIMALVKRHYLLVHLCMVRSLCSVGTERINVCPILVTCFWVKFGQGRSK